MRTLHVAGLGPITKNFFSFLENRLDCAGHELISTKEVDEWPPLHTILNISTGNKIAWVLKLFWHANKADKIIIHGLFGWPLVVALAVNPWLLKRCYWVMWGADLYNYKSRENSFLSNQIEGIRAFVIERIGHLVTYIEGDVDLARRWYGAKGKHHECLMYTSNVYSDLEIPGKPRSIINIQVGNSADPSNNHFEILKKLLPFKDQDIFIYAPLSYGDHKHALAVAEKGINMFGSKFQALTELMPFDEYLEFLEKIDIAVFFHKRQQAMGNIISLLGLGKTVYMNRDITTWTHFTNENIALHDTNNFAIRTLSNAEIISNKKIININYSQDKLINQWSNIFHD